MVFVVRCIASVVFFFVLFCSTTFHNKKNSFIFELSIFALFVINTRLDFIVNLIESGNQFSIVFFAPVENLQLTIITRPRAHLISKCFMTYNLEADAKSLNIFIKFHYQQLVKWLHSYFFFVIPFINTKKTWMKHIFYELI